MIGILVAMRRFSNYPHWRHGAVRQKMIEQLMREIMNYDAEFRQQDAMGADRSHARSRIPRHKIVAQ